MNMKDMKEMFSEKAIKLNYLEICFGNVSLNYNLYFIFCIFLCFRNHQSVDKDC